MCTLITDVNCVCCTPTDVSYFIVDLTKELVAQILVTQKLLKAHDLYSAEKLIMVGHYLTHDMMNSIDKQAGNALGRIKYSNDMRGVAMEGRTLSITQDKFQFTAYPKNGDDTALHRTEEYSLSNLDLTKKNLQLSSYF